MDKSWMEAGRTETASIPAEEEPIQYEYGGYQIRVHFSGERTLAQCLKGLAERRTAASLREE